MLVPMAWYDPIVQFGSTLMQPLYWAVSGLLVLFHYLWSPLLGADSGWTWVLSIVCLTVIIRVLLIPLFVRQIKSSRQMQLIQPKVRELQKKYGHDRQKLGEETMKLYREEGANPMASCLPLLLQSPIFFALFRVLDGAAHGIPRGQWLKDRQDDLLPSLQNAEIFGARISDTFMGVGFANGITSIHVVCVLLIIAMTVTMFITQLQLMRKNMPPEALTGQFAQQQKIMLYVFPLAFAGGLFLPPEAFPSWLDAFSQATPTRAGRDLLVQALTGQPAYGLAWVVLLGWTALFAALAVWAYRRDEGRRFR
jgi:YidC/Oxa1 family membrane protein insertase